MVDYCVGIRGRLLLSLRVLQKLRETHSQYCGRAICTV